MARAADATTGRPMSHLRLGAVPSPESRPSLSITLAMSQPFHSVDS